MPDRNDIINNLNSVEKFYLGNLYTRENNELLSHASTIIQSCIDDGVALFYDQLLLNPSGKQFLSTELVQQRLRFELKNWLLVLLSPKAAHEIDEMISAQVHVGVVHARIDVPMSLVDGAMMLIKHHIFNAVLKNKDLNDPSQAKLLLLIDSIMMASLSIIDESYVKNSTLNERVAQEYRSQVSAHDIALEIERVKFNLYNWFTQFVSASLLKNQPTVSILQTEFGLWVNHKLYLFCTQLDRVNHLKDLLRQIHEHTQAYLEQSVSIESIIEHIQQLMTDAVYVLTLIADQNIIDAKQKDTLTKLIERRFMTPIMQKEIQLAHRQQRKLCLLMLDIDDFKRINDLYGHAAGDKVLEEVGKAIRQSIRLSDYAFRYGGEELMVLLPETQLDEAVTIAEKMRQRIADVQIMLETERHISVTTSIGVAEYFDHPDYMRLIKASDQKLYEAKRTGKNKVCF